MKRYTLLLIAACLCLANCNNKKKENEKQKSELIYNYAFINFIGEDKWGSPEKYYKFVSNKENNEQLKKKLEIQGYDIKSYVELDNALFYYELESKEPYLHYNKSENDVSLLEYNLLYYNDFLALIFVKLKYSNSYEGTYKEFKESLLEKDGFVECFDICCELGIVDSWQEFISNMLEPDCDWCIEYLKENCECEDYIEELKSDYSY